jgi:hypothetical protein
VRPAWGAVIVLAAWLPAVAGAANLGVGAFGGASIPIVQDDSDTGTQYGLRVPVRLARFLTLEPYYAHTALGDVSATFDGLEYQRSGFDIDEFGINLLLGSTGVAGAFPIYPFAGVASHSLSRDGSDDLTEVGYELGLGLGFGLPHGIGIDLRGAFDFVVIGDGTRKAANINLGLSYKLWARP